MPSSICLETISLTAARSLAACAFSSPGLSLLVSRGGVEEIGRPRQAAGVRGDDALAAASHDCSCNCFLSRLG